MFRSTHRLLLCLTVLCGACLALVAQEEQTESKEIPLPESVNAPTTMHLVNTSLFNVAAVRETGDVYHIAFREDSLNPIFDSPNLTLGSSLFQTNIDTEGVKLDWLPVSLYVTPFIKTATFTKTGAAVVVKDLGTKREKDTADNGAQHSELTTDTIVHRTRYLADPNAQTTFTYNRLEVYGVITADAHHIFDLKGTPFNFENERVGIGVHWASHPDITDGVAYDKEHAKPFGLSKPNHGVRVRTQGIELSRSIDNGPPTWYLGYVTTY